MEDKSIEIKLGEKVYVAAKPYLLDLEDWYIKLERKEISTFKFSLGIIFQAIKLKNPELEFESFIKTLKADVFPDIAVAFEQLGINAGTEEDTKKNINPQV